jgi:hypothetical protein
MLHSAHERRLSCPFCRRFSDFSGLYVMAMIVRGVFGRSRHDVLQFAELISSNGCLRFGEPRAER